VLADFSDNLGSKPPAANGSVAFPAIQFLLWTGVKRIYIVGADITEGRRIGEEKATQDYVRQNHLQRWQEFERWVGVAYPDVEITPLNPIGLAGMFSLRVKDKVVAQPAPKLAVAGQGRFRLHCLAPPHAITAPGFSHCGFTNKLRHFCKFMTEAGHVVWHYGHENSEVVCTEHVTVSDDSTIAAYADWKNTSYNGRLDDECNKAFTANAIREIKKRLQPRDFILCFYGVGNKSVADAFPNAIIVEPGIGSFKAFAPFRVFESYALMHHTYGREATKPKFYDVVIPAFLDPSEFRYSEKKEDWLLFLGRVQPIKGVTVAIDIAKRAGRKLKIAGQGTLKDVPSHVEMLGYADPVMKADLLSRATALVQPSLYMEPFGNNAIEAAVSGTPTICVDWGGFTENVIHGATGWRCRTMSQFDWAVAFIDKIAPAVCRQWALGNYTVEQARLRYEEYLKDVWGVFFGCDFNGSDKERADVVGPRRFVR
jgi:glycosyltransferase involved in cell wall biosynthesis